MDEQVIAAMARWPNVPAVYGWLSLSESGQWRLHPGGDALLRPDSCGEPITSPQILAFIDRNYDADALGQWYFQNGPQQVYVRLDAAPFVAHTTIDASSGRLRLRTHTGLDVRDLNALYLDEHGRMYAATDRGACLIAGRDLPALLDALRPAEAGGAGAGQAPQTDAHDALLQCLETGATLMLSSTGILGFPSDPVALHHCPGDALETTLGFHRLPQEPATPSAGTPVGAPTSADPSAGTPSPETRRGG